MKQICSAIIILVAVLCFNYVSALIVGSTEVIVYISFFDLTYLPKHTMLGYAHFSNGCAASASMCAHLALIFPFLRLSICVGDDLICKQILL